MLAGWTRDGPAIGGWIVPVGRGRTVAVPWVDCLFSTGQLRKWVWGRWYPFLTRRLRAEDVLFLNYAFEEAPAMGIPLIPADEQNRGCIQLYHHVASLSPIRGCDVLEVSCGHGGGADYLVRAFQPRSYRAIDLNPEGIGFCRSRYRAPGLEFSTGDAGELPVGDGSVDAVINVEASHCYPDLARFLAEVGRVLRPGGCFHYADFRFADGVAAWETTLRACPLTLVASRDISREVQRGMELNSARSSALVERHLPRLLQSLGRDFAGVEGARVHRALCSGGLIYRSYLFRKPTATR